MTGSFIFYSFISYYVALEFTFIWFSTLVLTVLLLRNIFFISHLLRRKGLGEVDENSKSQNKNGKGKIGKSGVSLLLSSENQNGNFKSKPLILSAENLESNVLEMFLKKITPENFVYFKKYPLGRTI